MKTLKDFMPETFKSPNEIIDALCEYFVNYVNELEQQYNSKFDYSMIIKFDEDEIKQLKELGFHSLLSRLENLEVMVFVGNSQYKTKLELFRIACFRDRIYPETYYALNRELAAAFIEKKLTLEELEKRCQFWFKIIREALEQENKYVNEVKNKLAQSKIYKETMILKRF